MQIGQQLDARQDDPSLCVHSVYVSTQLNHNRNVHQNLMSFPWAVGHLSMKLCENQLSSFSVILLINKQTNWKLNPLFQS